jgi:glycerol-3-phosphate dehydrogenase subunit C
MKIDPHPKQPPATSPLDPRYFDAPDLESELKRQFEVCHGCRMCVNYCGSFPDLFARVDRDIARGAEGSERLQVDDFHSVTDLCWQCKLCYIDCPYTVDQQHAWALDIPRLLMREKAQRAAREGVSLQDQALGEPGQLGFAASGAASSMVNFVSRNRLVRKANEKLLGISAEFPTPPFAAQSFQTWLDKRTPSELKDPRGGVALFATCLGDYNFPEIARDAVRVLEKNGFAVERPTQVCCGIPNLDGGDVRAATEKARINVQSLHVALQRGLKVVCPGPSCAYTIRKEYPDLLGSDEAKYVAAHTMDLFEFLDSLRKDKTLNREFQSGLGQVAYHSACHLRAQKIGTPGARILGLLPDTEVEIIDKCSAVDGTWGMKTQYYEMGRKYAGKLVRGVDGVIEAATEKGAPYTVVTDCPLSAQRLRHENKVDVLHPISALARAYGLETS